MSNQWTSALLAAAATALITVLVAWLQEIVRNRGQENSRQRSLSQVKDEIAAIEAWSNARIALASDRESDDLRGRVCRDLDAVYQRLRAISAESDGREGEEKSTRLRGVVSRLLLRHIPTQGWSRLVRFLYYIALVMLFFWIGVAISVQKSWTDPAEIIASIFVYVIFAVLPTLFLYWLIIRLSRRPTGSLS